MLDAVEALAANALLRDCPDDALDHAALRELTLRPTIIHHEGILRLRSIEIWGLRLAQAGRFFC